MIDTQVTKVDRPLRPELLKAIEVNHGILRQDDWFFKISPDLDSAGTFRTELWGEHDLTKIRLRGHNNVVEKVEGSLPEVLFGDNGRLIRTPEQLAEAQVRFRSVLDEVTTVQSPRNEYIRLDLVLQFRCDIDRFIAAHRHCRHPLIRNETRQYGDRSLRLPGTYVAVSFYDKHLQKGMGPGDVLRVEIQLKKPKLWELFGKTDRPLYAIDFGTCYRVYRKILCAFKPVGIPETLCLNSLLAHCEASSFKLPNGLTAMENYKACVEHDTYLARRRKVKDHILSAAGIDWATLLPEFHLPGDLPDVILPTPVPN